MATLDERILKIESDARYAQYIALQGKAITDYNVMMGTIEDPNEGMEDEINE